MSYEDEISGGGRRGQIEQGTRQIIGKKVAGVEMRMDFEAQLKLQAFLDGELPEAEARELSDKARQDPEATALLGELRLTREAFKGFEQDIKLPESREFYWSKIQRQLEPQEVASQPARAGGLWLR